MEFITDIKELKGKTIEKAAMVKADGDEAMLIDFTDGARALISGGRSNWDEVFVSLETDGEYYEII